jgi:phage major head subunit gpT-like protein
MDLTPVALNVFFYDLVAQYNKGYKAAPSYFEEFCITRPSKGRQSLYGWVDRVPKLRQWIGPREIQNLVAQEYTVANILFELTVGISRSNLEDDIFNFYGGTPSQVGKQSKTWPDDVITPLLQAGTTTNSFDGVPFFSANHPIDTTSQVSGTQSNRFDSSTSGIAPLNATNAASIIASMASLLGRDGKPLGFRATHVMVPPQLQFAAHQIFDSQIITQAVTSAGVIGNPTSSVVGVAATGNVLNGTCKIIVNEFLANDANTYYFFDLRDKEMQPMLWQLRKAPEFVWLNRPDDPNVFNLDQYLYGVRARGNAGYGLWFTAARGSNS